MGWQWENNEHSMLNVISSYWVGRGPNKVHVQQRLSLAIFKPKQC